jgi:hypothetical protein
MLPVLFSSKGKDMKRHYCISKVELIEGNDGLEAVCTARAYGRVVAQNIALDNQGQLIDAWSLCIVESENIAPAMSDSDVIVLPQYSLDAKVSAMHTPTKTAMVNAMKKLAIPTDWIGNADGFREVIRTLGKMHTPAFDENQGSWMI